MLKWIKQDLKLDVSQIVAPQLQAYQLLAFHIYAFKMLVKLLIKIILFKDSLCTFNLFYVLVIS